MSARLLSPSPLSDRLASPSYSPPSPSPTPYSHFTLQHNTGILLPLSQSWPLTAVHGKIGSNTDITQTHTLRAHAHTYTHTHTHAPARARGRTHKLTNGRPRCVRQSVTLRNPARIYCCRLHMPTFYVRHSVLICCTCDAND